MKDMIMNVDHNSKYHSGHRSVLNIDDDESEMDDVAVNYVAQDDDVAVKYVAQDNKNQCVAISSLFIF
jgi:hypothetical protein